MHTLHVICIHKRFTKWLNRQLVKGNLDVIFELIVGVCYPCPNQSETMLVNGLR